MGQGQGRGGSREFGVVLGGWGPPAEGFGQQESLRREAQVGGEGYRKERCREQISLALKLYTELAWLPEKGKEYPPPFFTLACQARAVSL